MDLSQKVYDTIVFIQEQKEEILEGIKHLD
jgi:hypothetical protein